MVAAHSGLGNALRKKGLPDEAVREHREAVRLGPGNPSARVNLGAALHANGSLDEAITEYREAIRIDRRVAVAHYNLGAALNDAARRDKGRWDKASAEYRAAIAEYRAAVALNPRADIAHRSLRNALLECGRLDEAAEAMREWLKLLPDQHPQRQENLQLLERCQELIALDRKLPAILREDIQPGGPKERLDLAQLCLHHKQCYATSARFYTEAFAEQPRLADDLGAAHRHYAARAAAQAGCGQGADANLLPDKVALALRRQALGWLRDDLAAWKKQPDRAEARHALEHWQKDADLACVRDQKGLAQLPEPEREEWRRFWDGVAAPFAGAGAAP